MAYGLHPPNLAKGIKVSLAKAEEIFNRYHYELFPKIAKYREEVLETLKTQGYVHLGLGFRLYSDKPDKDIKSAANAVVQFWSILTMLTINKIHQLIDKNDLQEDVKVIATIYDSIYFEVTECPSLIKELNEIVVDLLTRDFMENQIVHNEAELDIGYNWYDMVTLSNNASLEEVEEAIKKAKELLSES